jgi:hypothetical protein
MPAVLAPWKHSDEQYFRASRDPQGSPHMAHNRRGFFNLGLPGMPFLAATLAATCLFRSTCWQSIEQHRLCLI